VLIIGCPPTTTEEGLWKQFPTAERIRLPAHEGKPTGTAFVRFPTVAAAEEAAGMGAVVVMGKHVRLEMGGAPPTLHQPWWREADKCDGHGGVRRVP